MKDAAAQGVRRRGPAAELDTVLAGRPMWGLSGFLDPLNRRVESLQRCYGGQEGQEARSRPRGVELWRRTGSPPAASGGIPMASRAGVAGAGLGQLSGAKAELRWGLSGARMRRYGVASVAHGALRGRVAAVRWFRSSRLRSEAR